MSADKVNPYLKTQILTASREQLQLMLFDGIIRFAEQAKRAIADRDYEVTHHFIGRSQKILLELISALRPEVHPDLCKNLSGLYGYVYRQLLRANVKKDPDAVDEALRVVRVLRDAWAELLDKLRSEQPGAEQSLSELASNLKVVG